MNDAFSLTESQIRAWVEAGSFERGVGYYWGGHIVNPRCQGNALKARCHGSMVEPYRLQATLGPEGVLSADCSCPVGAGGHCKHVVAMLLAWVHHPGEFLEIEVLETALQRRGKEELVAIIKRMLDRDPDLETLVELPVPGYAHEALDPEIVRRRVIDILSSHTDLGWQSGYAVADDLMGLIQIGEEYVAHQAWDNAVIVLRVVIEETLGRYYQVHEEEGEILETVLEFLELMGPCFAAVEDEPQRAGVLHTLFEAYRWDLEYGGVGIGQRASHIILADARPKERQRVTRWLREALPEGDAWDQVYKRRKMGSFLLALEEEQMDDAAFLALCRETDQEEPLVDRLLSLGRVREAAGVGRQSSDYTLFSLAGIFVAHEQGDLAEELVRERLQTIKDTRLIEWLQERAKERGDLEEALSLEERLFWRSPSLEGYQRVRALARLVERWSYLREVIVERLADEEELPLLIEIHVDEGKIDLALEMLRKMREGGRYWAGYLDLEVAQAAEDSHPRAAIRLYMEMVERLIAARGRGNYSTAATYLARVRELYHRLEKGQKWRTLIAQLREDNRRLPALQDELDKAGL